MATKIDLVNKALVIIGEDTVNSLTEETAPAKVADSLFDIVADAALASHPWRFAAIQATLTKLSSTPTDEWNYMYQLPTDLLALIRVDRTGSSPISHYELFQDKLYTDYGDGITVEYIYKTAETAYPPHFNKALVYQLAADMSVAITENTKKFELFIGLADREWKIAKHIDSRQRPGHGIEDDAGIVSMRY